MKDKSIAAVMEKANEPLRMREFPIPEVKEGCVLVKTLASGVCGTDVHCWRGQVKMPLPMILGHESVGTIDKLGTGRSADSMGEPIAQGDRVFWVAGHPCGKCYGCVVLKDTTVCSGRRAYGTSYSCADYPYLAGGYSEYVFLTERSFLFKVPEAVPSEAAIAFGCGFPTAVKGFEVIGGVRPGTSVLIQGAGPVGLSCVVLAKLGGANPITVMGAPQARLEMARRLGADHAIDIAPLARPEDRVKKAREVAGEADLCIEASGFPGAVAEGVELVRANGRYLVMGVFSDLGPAPVNPSIIVRRNLKLFGSVFWEPRHLHEVLRLLALYNDRLKLEDAVSAKYALENATQALQDVEALKCVKAIISPCAA
ncbi:MAG: zinc-binding dehydrogenase [Betaproteobacteria bacterium]|nr:zinc-binding dehydrogenase [Betaproteobacteria bacterium]MBI2959997.1 zinc-binding dehydrogenase [Betaproteobacteria bacterium]